MELKIGCLRNVKIRKSTDGESTTIKLTEMDGNYYGATSEIKIPAKSYEMLEEAIVENWLEKKKSLIQE